MNRIKVSDKEWACILVSLKKLPGVHIGLPDICRQFVSAFLWILRSGGSVAYIAEIRWHFYVGHETHVSGEYPLIYLVPRSTNLNFAE